MSTRGHDYPYYSEPPDDRAKVYFYFAGIAIVLVALVGFIPTLITALFDLLTAKNQVAAMAALVNAFSTFRQQFNSVFFYLTGASPLLVYYFINRIFNRYLWKTDIGRTVAKHLGIVVPPNLAEVYVAEIEWDAVKNDASRIERCTDKSQAEMRIIQTWTKIAIIFSFKDASGTPPRASSYSRMAFIEELPDETVRLEYIYDYFGVERADSNYTKKNRFSGTCVLEFYKLPGGKWTFTGHYYSDDLGTGIIRHKTDFDTITRNPSLSDPIAKILDNSYVVLSMPGVAKLRS